MPILIFILMIIVLTVSGCATTKAVLLSTKDQVGVDRHDFFNEFHYAYLSDKEIVVCTEVSRRENNTFDLHTHFDLHTYEIALQIAELENIRHIESTSYAMRKKYIYKRGEINECKSQEQLVNIKLVPIRKIEDHDLYKSGLRYIGKDVIDHEKISRYGYAGGLIFTRNHRLLYVNQHHSIIEIKSFETVTKGNRANYAFVPFAAAFDIISLPFSALYFLTFIGGT